VLAAALVGLRAGISSTSGTVALKGAFLVGIMAAAAAASAAAVGDVVATAAARVERAVAIAAALVGLRAGLSSTSGTIAFGGGFLVEIIAAAAAAASAVAVGDVVATAAARVERTVALAATLVNWRRGGLSPTAGTVAAFQGALEVGMTDV
jgi:uncharacterized protein (UPF0218 family)